MYPLIETNGTSWADDGVTPQVAVPVLVDSPYVSEWWDAEEAEWTEFPLLREAVSEELHEYDDEELAELIAAQGFDPEALESVMGALSDVGQAVGTGAGVGASIGSVVPGIGTAIGTAAGGIIGGLAAILTQMKANKTPPKSALPARPTTPGRPAPAKAGPRPDQPKAQAGASSRSAQAAQHLISALANPQVIQALVALALGEVGRQSLPVAGREVPATAFAELVNELAQESLFEERSGEWPSEEAYLLSEHGEGVIDLASPAERAGALIGLLALESIGEELPAPDLSAAQPVSDLTPASPAGWEPDGGMQPEYVEEAWETEPDIAEGGPALLAVAGTLISVAELGVATFEALQTHVLSGNFSVSAQGASYIHSPSPAGLTVQTKVFTLPLSAHHPRAFWGTQSFILYVTVEYDGFSIRRVAIAEDSKRSSTLTTSDFKISFVPTRFSPESDKIAIIAYTIDGLWDPHGLGRDKFDGSFRIDAQGNLTNATIRSSEGWVRLGRITSRGGGPVPKPVRAINATDVHFDPPGSTKLTEASIRHIYGWYTGLPSALKKEIEAGRIPIQLTGRASTTATVQRNQAIARARAESVARALRDLAGTSASLLVKVHGELGARTPDEKENRGERRVEITCEYEVYR